jgi:hypothetical protein
VKFTISLLLYFFWTKDDYCTILSAACEAVLMHRVTRILVFKNNKNFVSWNISIPRIRLTRTNPPPITRIVLFVRLYWDWNITSRSIYHNKTNPAWLIWGFIPNSLNLSNSPLQHVFSNPHILPCDPRRTACCCDFNFWAFHIEWNLFKNWIGQLLMKLFFVFTIN